MHAEDSIGIAESVVPLHHDGDLVLEAHDLRPRDGQASLPGEDQAEMLVLRVTLEVGGPRLQDVRRGNSS